MRDDRTGRPGLPSNGHRPNGTVVPLPYTRVLATADEAEAPVDLVSVQVDDELVSALGARPSAPVHGDVVGLPTGGPGAPNRDDRLVTMLAAWRAEIDAEPIPELVDLDTAVAAVVAGMQAQGLDARRKRATRLRQLAPLAAAAAIIVATVTGVGLGSQNAVPGDTLWAVQKVVNPERVESVEAKVEVESRLQKVRSALEKGDTVTAAKELEEVRTQIPVVRGQEGQPQLAQEQEFLAAKLADTPPGTPADLTTPPKSNPKARSTAAPAAPPASSSTDPAAVDPSVTGPSVPGSAEPKSTEPDPRSRERDKAGAAVAPGEPGSSGPVQPAPKPEPQVTNAPDEPKPKPKSKPEPTSPADEGAPDRTTAPDPVVPPARGADDGSPSPGGAGSGPDSTTASGSAGADVDTTVTDTTT